MRTMHIADEITRVEAEAAQSGISIEVLCREAGIHRATGSDGRRVSSGRR